MLPWYLLEHQRAQRGGRSGGSPELLLMGSSICILVQGMMARYTVVESMIEKP